MILSPYATEPICETDERQLQNSFSLKERAEKIKQCVEQVMTRGQHHEHLRPRSGTCQFGLNCGKSGMRSLISFLTESAAVPVVMTSSLPLLIPQCASLSEKRNETAFLLSGRLIRIKMIVSTSVES